MPSSAWRSDVCSSDRSEEHTSELQSQSNLVCRIIRSEEHTPELQSQPNLVCRLLLEKKQPPTPPAPTFRSNLTGARQADARRGWPSATTATSRARLRT